MAQRLICYRAVIPDVNAVRRHAVGFGPKWKLDPSCNNPAFVSVCTLRFRGGGGIAATGFVHPFARAMSGLLKFIKYSAAVGGCGMRELPSTSPAKCYCSLAGTWSSAPPAEAAATNGPNDHRSRQVRPGCVLVTSSPCQSPTPTRRSRLSRLSDVAPPCHCLPANNHSSSLQRQWFRCADSIGMGAVAAVPPALGGNFPSSDLTFALRSWRWPKRTRHRTWLFIVQDTRGAPQQPNSMTACLLASWLNLLRRVLSRTIDVMQVHCLPPAQRCVHQVAALVFSRHAFNEVCSSDPARHIRVLHLPSFSFW